MLTLWWPEIIVLFYIPRLSSLSSSPLSSLLRWTVSHRVLVRTGEHGWGLALSLRLW